MFGMVPKDLEKGLEKYENLRTYQDRPDYSIVEIGQNTEKSPET